VGWAHHGLRAKNQRGRRILGALAGLLKARGGRRHRLFFWDWAKRGAGEIHRMRRRRKKQKINTKRKVKPEKTECGQGRRRKAGWRLVGVWRRGLRLTSANMVSVGGRCQGPRPFRGVAKAIEGVFGA